MLNKYRGSTIVKEHTPPCPKNARDKTENGNTYATSHWQAQLSVGSSRFQYSATASISS